MWTGFGRLRKLRGRSLREIGGRGAQEFSKLGERVFGSQAAEMSDDALLQEFVSSFRAGDAETTAQSLLERVRASLSPQNALQRQGPFSWLAGRNEIAAIIERRFPSERRDLLERAGRVIEGRFDLFGLTGISFGNPIDWQLEPISGRRAPLDHWSRVDYLTPEIAGDKKITWELNRHGHFVALGQAYYLTGDERYAEAFARQAGAWMDANPPKRGINWASSLELAFRCIAWLYALHLLAGSRLLTPMFVLRLLKFIVAQGRHVERYLSYYFSPNTHLTGEALGLFYLGVTLPELRRADTWRETGLRILLEQLPLHVRADGVYFEQATYYHRYTTDFYTHLYALARACRIKLPPTVEEKLALLLDHLMWITRPDGTSPYLGDDDGGRLVSLGARKADDFRDTLATGAALLGRGDWKHVAGQAAIETLWLLGPEGLARYDEIEPVPPHKQSFAFRDSGFLVMRDGWEQGSSYVVVDCGPHGALNCGHSHADALAFEFAAQGTTWLVDPGTYTYTGDARLRDWFRSTEAHNTATLDGQSQSMPSAPFSWSHIANARQLEFIAGDSLDYFAGRHDGYRRLADPVTHERSFLLVKAAGEFSIPSYLVIRDAFLARDRHSYQAFFHFTPECLVSATGNRLEASHANGNRLTVAGFGSAPLRASVEERWVSRCYGQRQHAPVGVVTFEGKGIQELFSFVIPSDAVSVQLSSTGRAFHVIAGESADTLTFADGQISHVRRIKKDVVRACLNLSSPLFGKDAL